MSKADELLHELLDASDRADMPRYVRAMDAARAYLNEKPHEPEKPVAWMYQYEGTNYRVLEKSRRPLRGGWTETPLYASPSAQPDARKALEVLVTAIKPLNPNAPESNEVEAVISKAAIIYANFVLLRTPPSAQPIARVEKFYCCPDCGHDTWLQHAADCSARKSAGKEST